MKNLLGKAKRLMKKYRYVFPFLFLLGLTIPLLLIIKDLPSPTKLSSTTLPQSTQIFDRNGKLLYTIYSQKNQTFIPLSAIPKSLQQATIAIEDKDFYRHGAIDIRGITRAAVAFVQRKPL